MKTFYVCYDCPFVQGLHKADCFQDYHTKLHYNEVQ